MFLNDDHINALDKNEKNRHKDEERKIQKKRLSDFRLLMRFRKYQNRPVRDLNNQTIIYKPFKILFLFVVVSVE